MEKTERSVAAHDRGCMAVLHSAARGQDARPVVHVTDDLAATAGPMIAAAIEDRLLKTGRCRIGLSGGGTPGPVYAWLRDNLPADWYQRLLITWVDERHLALDAPAGPGAWRSFHADSNLRGAYEHWLGDVAIDPSAVLPMSLGGRIEDQVVRFGRAFLTQFGGRLDVSILGAGPDGHIASLFPDHPGLQVDDVCLAVHDSPKPPRQRITLALPVLNAADFTFLLARGENKAAMLRRAYNNDRALPLAHIRPQGALHWVLDRPAASELLRTWTEADD